MNFIQSSVRICSLKVASKPAFWHSARKSSARWLRLPSSSPKIMRMKVPTCGITPGAMIEALICATPPMTALSPEDRDQPLGGVDAVLQRDDGGVGADQRLDGLARAFDVPQLDAEQHDIDHADLGGIIGRLRRHQMGVAARALNFQAIALHGRQMRAARNEGDVGARLGQRRAEIHLRRRRRRQPQYA